MRPAFLQTSLLCTALALSLPAAAQTYQRVPGFQLERLELDSSAVGSLTLASGLTIPRRSFRLFGALHYENNPLKVNVDGLESAAVVSDRLTLHLGLVYAIFEGFEVAVQVPVIVYQGGADISAYGLIPPDGFGFGAPTLAARYAFLRRSAGMGVDVAADVLVPIPLGSTAALANDPTFVIQPKVSAGFVASRLRFSIEAGAKIRPELAFGTGKLGSEFLWGAGGTLALDKFMLEVALKGSVGFSQQPAALELLAGARYSFGPVELFALGGPGMGGAPGVPAWRLVAGVAVGPTFGVTREKERPRERPKRPAAAPPARCVEGADDPKALCPNLDHDGDGILNADDKCPFDPEDKDAFQDDDGCPDLDNDGDGIVDTLDACPNTPGVMANQGCPADPPDAGGRAP